MVIGANGKLRDAKIANLEPVTGDSLGSQRERLDLIQSLNRQHLQTVGHDPDIEGMIASYELAFRMQSVAPEILKIDSEPMHIQQMYGIDKPATADFGKQCLLARRLVESGVRFVQLSTGNVWDQHSGLKEGHQKNALATDRPIAALIRDLQQRGLLDDTLVIWGGEFGRTPIAQGKNGRDHNPQGFTMWMCVAA